MNYRFRYKVMHKGATDSRIKHDGYLSIVSDRELTTAECKRAALAKYSNIAEVNATLYMSLESKEVCDE